MEGHTGGVEEADRTARGALPDSTIRLIATGFGSGFSPVAPGTAGTAAILAICGAASAVYPQLFASPASWIAAAASLPISVYFSGEAVRRRLFVGKKDGDPGQVVIDEFCGYLFSIAGAGAGLAPLLLGFVFFRIFDVTKPFPARRAERLPGGWGVTMDDVVAGIYAAICVRAVLWIL